jgi:hypothetical protein
VPPVGPVLAEARDQGALVDLDKHNWPWSIMLAVTGSADLYELANNHLWKTGFGFKRWEPVPAPAWMEIKQDEDGRTEWGWASYGFQMYYLFLNCGCRLRVSAGTASGVHPVPLGFGRVYVHLPGPFTYRAWIGGLDAGHSFVSTGPMLDVRFNGCLPGTVHACSEREDTAVRVVGTAESRRPLDRIEVVTDGRIGRVVEPANEPTPAGGYRSAIDEKLPDRGSCWVAVRCFEDHPQGRVRFAHTNPYFVDAGEPAGRPRAEEVDYLVERLEAELERNEGVLAGAALEEYRQALETCRNMAEKAHAGD